MAGMRVVVVNSSENVNIDISDLEEKVLLHPTVENFLNGFTPKKIIIVTGKIINVVI